MFSHLLLTTTPGLSAFPSVKNARNKTPQRQGTEPFHRLHLDLMRNPFRYGLTTNSNYSAYLFIVTTPGKLTGWIGLPTESTTSILIALKQWLTDTELLAAPNPSVSSALMLDLLLHQQNSSLNAPHLVSKLKLQPLNIKK
ncbi:hypothetical protein MHU86_8541 [Fragilaria crotonensis]|nr:hypothetical protein MHU86_8541 [Fragilaria crotonensis]